MSTVALLCPEPLGHGRPAGVGIRFLEFARLLTRAGHEVHVLSPDGGDVPGCTSSVISDVSIRDVTQRADVALVQGHVINELLAHGEPVPLVADLYDPFIVENLHYWQERGDEVFVHDHATLLRTVRHCDFFLCSSPAQRFFWAGLMMAAGRLNPATYWDDPTLDELMAIVPFGVPPLREAKRSASNRVLFGGIYDWYLPELAIDAIGIVRREIPDASLHFNVHPNEATPQRTARRAQQYADRLDLGGTVHFEPWVGYEKRGAYYDGFAAALLTFPPSLETDLSMRTRVLDWMWAGLPVVSSSAEGTDRLLRRYGSGTVVDSNDPADLAAALIDLLTNAERRAAIQESSRAFVADYQWEVLARPLLEFCADPEIDPTKDRFLAPEPAIGGRPAGILERIVRRIGGTS